MSNASDFFRNIGGGSFTDITGGGSINNDWYYIKDNLSYTLPAVTDKVATIVLMGAIGTSPTVVALGADVIKLDGITQDTSISFTEQAIIILVSSQVVDNHWDMIELMINANAATIGLDEVDNTSDADKPVSIATQTALDTLAVVRAFTVSGTMVAGTRINQLRDSGSFTMAPTVGLALNTTLTVELPSYLAAQTPSLTTGGSDVFRNVDGTDTVINFVGGAKITFTYSATNEWSF